MRDASNVLGADPVRDHIARRLYDPAQHVKHDRCLTSARHHYSRVARSRKRSEVKNMASYAGNRDYRSAGPLAGHDCRHYSTIRMGKGGVNGDIKLPHRIQDAICWPVKGHASDYTIEVASTHALAAKRALWLDFAPKPQIVEHYQQDRSFRPT